ncbi:hypothetical protein [Nocardioides sp.]|uniref:hypothetical protein n=1 Tax=Nocardioides sp. TaxID=35761 RepID=UPI003D0B9D7A
MTTDDRELTPAQEDAVRRRLAAARHTEPLPDAVAERLDRVLGSLADERRTTPTASSTPGAPVADLAARRRRTRATQLLVAAVAIVAVGFGFGQLTGQMGSDDSADSAAGGSSSDSRMPEGALDEPKGTDPTSRQPSTFLSDLALVTRDRFDSDVAAARDTESAASSLSVRKACLDPGPGEQAIAVRYAGKLATLVYRTPAGNLQKVDLYRCNPPGFVRSVEIPAP